MNIIKFILTVAYTLIVRTLEVAKFGILPVWIVVAYLFNGDFLQEGAVAAGVTVVLTAAVIVTAMVWEFIWFARASVKADRTWAEAERTNRYSDWSAAAEAQTNLFTAISKLEPVTKSHKLTREVELSRSYQHRQTAEQAMKDCAKNRW